MWQRDVKARSLVAAALLLGLALGSTHSRAAVKYTLIDLGTLGGSNSSAFGINARGQVVGDSQTAGNTATHAFLCEND